MPDEMVEMLATELYEHRIVEVGGHAQCACGWFVEPLLNSVHRLHTASVLLGDVGLRVEAMGRLLLDSGDITPMGVRMLAKIAGDASESGSHVG